jgi:hypothetical protein
MAEGEGDHRAEPHDRVAEWKSWRVSSASADLAGRVGWWESELSAWKASRAPRSKSYSPSSSKVSVTVNTPRAFPMQTPPEPVREEANSAEKRVRARERQACEGQIAFEF